MNPTNEFRWAQYRAGTHPMAPSAISPYQQSPIVLVLEQRWVSDLVGVPDEWRALRTVWRGDE